MILESNNLKTKTNFDGIKAFQIKDDAKLFKMLSDTIYADKISAVIRELTCNAIDAHKNLSDKKVIVTLPFSDSLEFSVEDFGCGLTEEDMSMYTTYGFSTKDQSNDFTGCFGIGSKSPFSYTESFTVKSTQNNIEHTYLMYLDNGYPKMTKLQEVETNKVSGLKVSLVVLKEDVREFLHKAFETLKYVSSSVEILCKEHTLLQDFVEVSKSIEEIKMPLECLGEGYFGSNLFFTKDRYGRGVKVIQSGVQYFLSSEEIYNVCKDAITKIYANKKDSKCALFERAQEKTSYLSMVGTLYVPNGTFEPQPSREKISFNKSTTKNFNDIFEKLYTSSITEVIEDYKNTSTNSLEFLDKIYTSQTKNLASFIDFNEVYFDNITLNNLIQSKFKARVMKYRYESLFSSTREFALYDFYKYIRNSSFLKDFAFILEETSLKKEIKEGIVSYRDSFPVYLDSIFIINFETVPEELKDLFKSYFTNAKVHKVQVEKIKKTKAPKSFKTLKFCSQSISYNTLELSEFEKHDKQNLYGVQTNKHSFKINNLDISLALKDSYVWTKILDVKNFLQLENFSIVSFTKRDHELAEQVGTIEELIKYLLDEINKHPFYTDFSDSIKDKEEVISAVQLILENFGQNEKYRSKFFQEKLDAFDTFLKNKTLNNVTKWGQRDVLKSMRELKGFISNENKDLLEYHAQTINDFESKGLYVHDLYTSLVENELFKKIRFSKYDDYSKEDVLEFLQKALDLV